MKKRVSCKKSCLHENQDKRRGDWREKRERKYDWIAIYFEETIHWRCSFYEQCLYDMVSIKTTSSVLGWNCPKMFGELLHWQGELMSSLATKQLVSRDIVMTLINGKVNGNKMLRERCSMVKMQKETVTSWNWNCAFSKKKRLELRLVSRAALASHSHRQRIASFRDEHLSIQLRRQSFCSDEAIIPWPINTTTIFSTQSGLVSITKQAHFPLKLSPLVKST